MSKEHLRYSLCGPVRTTFVFFFLGKKRKEKLIKTWFLAGESGGRTQFNTERRALFSSVGMKTPSVRSDKSKKS